MLLKNKSSIIFLYFEKSTYEKEKKNNDERSFRQNKIISNSILTKK